MLEPTLPNAPVTRTLRDDCAAECSTMAVLAFQGAGEILFLREYVSSPSKGIRWSCRSSFPNLLPEGPSARS